MRNEDFDQKIMDEIIVDCEDQYDQNMSWFYYVQEEIAFPFIAYVEVRKKKQRSGTQVFKKVNVIGLATDDSNFDNNFDLKVDVEFDDYIIEFPLSKLEDVRASESTIETIELWKYWISR
jgi:hypothetical protein